jgi:hypothetical protein
MCKALGSISSIGEKKNPRSSTCNRVTWGCKGKNKDWGRNQKSSLREQCGNRTVISQLSLVGFYDSLFAPVTLTKQDRIWNLGQLWFFFFCDWWLCGGDLVWDYIGAKAFCCPMDPDAKWRPVWSVLCSCSEPYLTFRMPGMCGVLLHRGLFLFSDMHLT